MNATTAAAEIIREIDETIEDVREYLSTTQEPPERAASDVLAKLEVLSKLTKEIAQK